MNVEWFKIFSWFNSAKMLECVLTSSIEFFKSFCKTKFLKHHLSKLFHNFCSNLWVSMNYFDVSSPPLPRPWWLVGRMWREGRMRKRKRRRGRWTEEVGELVLLLLRPQGCDAEVVWRAPYIRKERTRRFKIIRHKTITYTCLLIKFCGGRYNTNYLCQIK